MKCLFHIHTIYSDDGHIQLAALHDRLRARGIDAVCITDHNTIEGALRFRQRFPDITTVVGEEVMTQRGEVIGLFLDTHVEPGQPLQETVAAIRRQGGLVALPHPCDTRRPSSLRPECLGEAVEHADILEVHNGRTFDRRCDHRAQALCTASQRIPIWGADAHYPEEVNHATFGMEPFSDAASFLGALRRAQPGRLTPTSLPQRMLLRLKRRWGSYGPLTLPERLLLAMQRSVLRTVGGGFVALAEVDSWCEALATRVRASGFEPDVVVGLASGGLYPAYCMARLLGTEYDSLRVSYPQVRIGHLDTDDLMGAIVVRNRILGNEPRLLSIPRSDLANRKVLLVDDDCTTGRSLRLAQDAIRGRAAEIRTLTLRVLAAANPCPDFFHDDRTGAVFRHPRFPWIKYSPEYPIYAAYRDRWLL